MNLAVKALDMKQPTFYTFLTAVTCGRKKNECEKLQTNVMLDHDGHQ